MILMPINNKQVEGRRVNVHRFYMARSMWTLVLHSCDWWTCNSHTSWTHLWSCCMWTLVHGNPSHGAPGGQSWSSHWLQTRSETQRPELLSRADTFLHRHFLQHLAVLLLQLVWSAAPGQSRCYSSMFPLQNHGAHRGARQVQQGGNLAHSFPTQVASNYSATLKVTQLLTSTHSCRNVCSLHVAFISPPPLFPFLRFLVLVAWMQPLRVAALLSLDAVIYLIILTNATQKSPWAKCTFL